ncbi:hypothetical protein SDC9_150845 [bioreactor metagenome]|uniref:Uncharacterized protein n=1 Tax=bioreactor metagenome TaxID=1076179 RepID=A0A645ESZ1_9ZZZZ
MLRTPDLRVGHQGGFLGAAGRKHLMRLRRACGLGADRQCRGQRTAHRAQRARQRQLPRELIARKPGRVDHAASGEDAHGNRQVEAPRILGQIGGRQVHRDLLVGGELQPRVLQRRAHALARLLHFHVGQAHQGEAGQAVGQVHLNGDGRGLQPCQGAALH